MDSATVLTQPVDSDPSQSGLRDAHCPDCAAAPLGALTVTSSLFSLSLLCRCSACGSRFRLTADGPCRVRSCSDCGLPYLPAEQPSAGHDLRCEDCVKSRGITAVDPSVVVATEEEVRAGLERHWRLVTSPPLASYLNRIARQVAGVIEGAPAAPRVVLCDTSTLRVLALPSGIVVISRGLLSALEDEAELVYVTARALSQLASEASAQRWVRFVFHSLAEEPEAASPEAWARAAEELAVLGYGLDEERRADSRAIEALVELGYDPRSVLRYLERVADRIDRGDTALREIASRCPPARQRKRWIERRRFSRRTGGAVPRVNRELFRRAAGQPVRTGELIPLVSLARVDDVGEQALDSRPGSSWLIWALAGVLLLAALFLVVGSLLAD